ADIVVIAPGNLYGSLAPALIVKGIRRSLKKTTAKIVYVCNLVTKPGQTDGFLVHDYVDEVERFLGGKLLDFVIFNTDEPSEQQLSKYTHDGEYIIGFDLSVMEAKHYKTFGLPLIDKSPVTHADHDPIARNRTLIRHDSDLVAREVMKILFP
ncbi:MAG: 2-phospho-L-lactate transferase CofD family protein, partial [Candidatus Saccharibacteria bacterium]|nr:2-phospho-L-lactate transferase CofD family protein [Candidatus Saccharibacteria bacterium]